jgi:hypothetical protein
LFEFEFDDGELPLEFELTAPLPPEFELPFAFALPLELELDEFPPAFELELAFPLAASWPALLEEVAGAFGKTERLPGVFEGFDAAFEPAAELPFEPALLFEELPDV